MTYDPWAELVPLPEDALAWALLAERVPGLFGVHMRLVDAMRGRSSPMHPTAWAQVMAEIDALPLTVAERAFVTERLRRVSRRLRPGL